MAKGAHKAYNLKKNTSNKAFEEKNKNNKTFNGQIWHFYTRNKHMKNCNITKTKHM